MGAFTCSVCGNTKTKVLETRYAGLTRMRRRRECKCGNTFSTYEIDQSEYDLLRAFTTQSMSKIGREASLLSKTIENVMRMAKIREGSDP